MPVMRDTKVSREMMEADLNRDMGIEFSGFKSTRRSL
jgi:hypothetical protein